MPAALAWLDYSLADQRRAREIVAMFTQRESRDELGLGRIRDALSETLFPGTTTLLTRARYFLFVPWLFREGARRGHSGPRLVSWVDYSERRLILALHEGGDRKGLIGRDALTAIQNLPSTIYWNGLRRFRILRHEGTATQVAGSRQFGRAEDDATELIERPDAVWDPSIPPAPEGFFDFARCDFALTPDESSWLAERIAESADDTMLYFLVTRGIRPSPSARYVWDEPEAHEATGRARVALDEAQRFAIAMHGAALLYNVLLAERAEELGLLEFESHRDEFALLLDDWTREVNPSDIGGWNLDQLWTMVANQGSPVKVPTRAFVTQWVDLIRKGIGTGLADDRDARALVRNREFHQKRSQARLHNDRLMRQWGGASGSGRLDFRWAAVAGILEDIVDGRERRRARS